MAQVGRISGPLLQENLLRNGSNLNFASTNAEINNNTPLMHLDVNNLRVGIKRDNPAVELDTDNLGTSNLLATVLPVANFNISNNNINAVVGDIFLRSSTEIKLSQFQNDDININTNNIITTQENSNLELRPNSSGFVEFYNNTNITGNLFSTGNITFGGNLTIGDDDTDTLDFNSDVNSDIIPTPSSTQKLGNANKKWENLYSNSLSSQQIESNTLVLDDTSLSLRHGNIFYVSTTGNDTNVGDHPQGPFRTIKHALSVVDGSSAGPTVIQLSPGTYQEQLPLVVPEFVTIVGSDIRNTIIKPSVGYEDQNVFELNDTTTIENLTIRDFQYNSINDTGYAFSYAQGAVMTNRSPYIRNLSVITSETSPSAGDAGRGALIDGDELDTNSIQKSMLFHSATFIVPNADAISMTNDVRVEWLNSFTYFANRGLYAFDGPSGGAEIRSIGSASVYGNYGAVADGVNTLMYLIGHNFAYIGAGINSSNDKTLTLPDQEAVELNSGKIYYTSTDAEGTFKVGNAFFVDFESGTTSIDASNVNFSTISSIFVRSGPNITYIDGTTIDTGNIKISGNTIRTIDGDLIWSPVTGLVDISNIKSFIIPIGTTAQRKNEESDFRFNTEINKFEGFGQSNITFGGIYSDDRLTNINANTIDDNIIFTIDNTEMGRITPDSTQFNKTVFSDIALDGNIITTENLNTDLELSSNGSSVVKLFDVSIDQNIFNNDTNSFLTFANTDSGYLKIDSTNGLAVGAGDNSGDRPINPQVGQTRYNTSEALLETWNGVQWIDSSGEGNTEVLEEDMSELTYIYTLILG